MLPNYYVIEWNTSKILATFDTLPAAKKYCRSLGHEAPNPLLTSYPPVAFVGNAQGEVIYNPYFKYTAEDQIEMDAVYKSNYQYCRNFFAS